MDFVKRFVAGILGGFLGGALVGFAEAVVVASVSAPSEFWVFVFGSVSYGFFGAAMGAGWAVAATVLPFARDDSSVLAWAGGLVVAALGLVVARFRVIRDVFGESLPIASGAGIAVHVGLLVAAAVGFLMVRSWLSGSAERRGAMAAGVRTSLGLVAGAFVAAVALNALRGAGDTTPAEAAGTAKGPSVLLIIVDTLRADHTSPYGAEDVDTPAMARLARDGVVFEKAFAHSSWTRPSIATILTSLYAASHSVMHKTDLLPDDVTTLAEEMKANGYGTAGFVTNINLATSFNFQQGFDGYKYLAPDFFFGATDSGSKLSLYSGMRLIRERFLSSSKYVNNYYQDGATVNSMSLPWVDRSSQSPFFALVHYMDPHDPYFEIPYNGRAVARVETPHPPAERAEELRELYVDNVEYFDQFLAAVIAELERLGLYEEMVIAITSDHGEEFYEHEGWWHGTTLYEEQIHVPLIVKLSGNRDAGRRVRSLAGLVDVMPTLLAAVGAAVPDSCQGRDLFGDSPAPKAVFAEEDHEGNVLESIRTADWKLIVANEGNPRGLEALELYNLRSDPGEQRNVASSETTRLAALKADLDLLKQAAAASAVGGVSGDIDEAAKERLRALGYIE